VFCPHPQDCCFSDYRQIFYGLDFDYILQIAINLLGQKYNLFLGAKVGKEESKAYKEEIIGRLAFLTD
jgi:hypothetical protein